MLLSYDCQESTHYYSGVGILTLAFIGIVVNLLGIIILIKKRNPSMFHALLKVSFEDTWFKYHKVLLMLKSTKAQSIASLNILLFHRF